MNVEAVRSGSRRCRTASRSSTRPAARRCRTRWGRRSRTRCAMHRATSARRMRPVARSRRSSPARRTTPRGSSAATADEISFGMNMTTLDFATLAPAARDFQAGDEIVTTQLDHDGGVAPWVELAEDKGLVVQVVERDDDLTVDYDDLERQLSDRTRVVAFALASNATGSVADAKRICKLAREAGAISWIDAVHYAAHEPIDVRELGCDVLLCSPYKFCGPHLGIAYVRRELAETWRPYKARPSKLRGSRPARCRTSCSPASARRSPISTRSAASRRSATTSASSARASSRGCPTTSRCTGRRRWTGACRRSSSTSTACRPTRGATARRTRLRRLVGGQLVLRCARAAPAGAVAARRDRALQHARRGRQAARRARCALRRRSKPRNGSLRRMRFDAGTDLVRGAEPGSIVFAFRNNRRAPCRGAQVGARRAHAHAVPAGERGRRRQSIARRCVHRLRVRRLHCAVDGVAEGVERIAVPRARHLHRRRRTAPAATANLTRRGCTTTTALGWSLLPLYVGLQAPCVSRRALEDLVEPGDRRERRAARLPTTPSRQAARSDSGGQPDLVRHGGLHDGNAACTEAVQAFVAAWDDELRALGFVAGVYGSAASTIRDMSTLGTRCPTSPGSRTGTASKASSATERQRQHLGEPPAYPPVQGRPQRDLGRRHDQRRQQLRRRRRGRRRRAAASASAAARGPVGSGDGVATAVVAAAAPSRRPVAVALTPRAAAAANGYAVQLAVTETDNSAPVDGFGAPVTLHITGRDGLDPGVLDGRHGVDAAPRRPRTRPATDGDVEIQTPCPACSG